MAGNCQPLWTISVPGTVAVTVMDYTTLFSDIYQLYLLH